MQEFYQLLNDKEQRDFIRMNPSWYKFFNRNHDAYNSFKTTFDEAKKQSTPSRLTKIDRHLNTANIMLKLLKGFK